jgi:ABC-type uncharacterized transport system permease subunit
MPITSLPLIWLRIATVLYGLGLLHILLLVTRKDERLTRVAVPAVGLGLVFHFVSITETALIYGYADLLTIRHAESVLALILVAVFMVVYARYATASPGIFVFPLVFLLTFASAVGQHSTMAPVFHSKGWIAVHVLLLLAGYASLFLSFVASLLYIVQSRSLKAKQSVAWLTKLPSLQTIDDLGYKALLLGFPFMTLGLIAGSVVAHEQFGPTYFTDPKVLLSMLMWGVYMLLLYTRWSSGWRGRKAAYLATFAFGAAVCAWAANYLSRVHRFVAP